eukprot:1156860-Pelagomonas_calceolata.AAC.5
MMYKIPLVEPYGDARAKAPKTSTKISNSKHAIQLGSLLELSGNYQNHVLAGSSRTPPHPHKPPFLPSGKGDSP